MPSRRRKRRKQLARHPGVFRARSAARTDRDAQSATDNADTYAYFGEPVYIYSLKEGINDGFLTPFQGRSRLPRRSTNTSTTPMTSVVEGEVEEGRRYKKPISTVKSRSTRAEAEARRNLHGGNRPNEKTLVFCATKLMRCDPRHHQSDEDEQGSRLLPSRDGERRRLGDQHLRDFQDNEKTIPTILTTSQKLSTGVDARNVRNIVLMRPINSMIEFKQIIGRGTRLFDGKDYFTIYDFVRAHQHFNDADWDGEPLEPVSAPDRPAKSGGATRCP